MDLVNLVFSIFFYLVFLFSFFITYILYILILHMWFEDFDLMAYNNCDDSEDCHLFDPPYPCMFLIQQAERYLGYCVKNSTSDNHIIFQLLEFSFIFLIVDSVC